MDKHPIENIMTTTMENIRDMVDVNTVVGDPIEAADGATVVPVSRVSFGFVAGGGEYALDARRESAPGPLPFAGGTGAGVTVQPVAFLVLSEGQVRLLPAQSSAPVERLIELVPQAMQDLKGLLCRRMEACSAPREPAPEGPAVPNEN